MKKLREQAKKELSWNTYLKTNLERVIIQEDYDDLLEEFNTSYKP